MLSSSFHVWGSVKNSAASMAYRPLLRPPSSFLQHDKKQFSRVIRSCDCVSSLGCTPSSGHFSPQIVKNREKRLVLVPLNPPRDGMSTIYRETTSRIGQRLRDPSSSRKSYRPICLIPASSNQGFALVLLTMICWKESRTASNGRFSCLSLSTSEMLNADWI